MSALDSMVLEPIERGFSAVGLNSDTSRVVVGAGVTAGLLFYFKPKMMFDGNNAKGFGSGQGQTLLPWWLASIGVGAVVGVFI